MVLRKKMKAILSFAMVGALLMSAWGNMSAATLSDQSNAQVQEQEAVALNENTGKMAKIIFMDQKRNVLETMEVSVQPENAKARTTAAGATQTVGEVVGGKEGLKKKGDQANPHKYRRLAGWLVGAIGTERKFYTSEELADLPLDSDDITLTPVYRSRAK